MRDDDFVRALLEAFIKFLSQCDRGNSVWHDFMKIERHSEIMWVILGQFKWIKKTPEIHLVELYSNYKPKFILVYEYRKVKKFWAIHIHSSLTATSSPELQNSKCTIKIVNPTCFQYPFTRFFSRDFFHMKHFRKCSEASEHIESHAGHTEIF